MQEYSVEIARADFSTVPNSSEAEVAFDKFSYIITSAVTSCTKHITTKRYGAPRCPWVSPSLLKSLRKKDNLYKKTKRKPFNMRLLHRYKLLSDQLNHALKNAKKVFFERKLIECSNDAKIKWKLINQFLNAKTSAQSITTIMKDDSALQDPVTISNAFCEFFSPTETVAHVEAPALIREPQSFFLRACTPYEVQDVITNLNNTGPGLDNIHSSHIKSVKHIISVPLCHIINQIFETGVFPRPLKRAKVVPIFKKGDPSQMQNYRPISILPFLSKVVEKLLEMQIHNYYAKFNILSPLQFGFRRGQSTESALLYFSDWIRAQLDSGMIAAAVFVDYTKAFDNINHCILFSKLESYGITGPALTLIKSYLSDRYQCVCIEGILSSHKLINKEVPQGSILGALLF